MSKTFIKVMLLVVLSASTAFAQGTGFHFQGRLNDGTNPANGRYDLQFGLFNAITGGTQIGTTVARPNTVLINGVFSATLDFGATAFNNPNSVFIEISVRPTGSQNAFTILGPRQQLTVVPFAVRATSAVDAEFANNAATANHAATATTATTAATATNALSLGGVEAGNYTKLNVVNTGDFTLNGTLKVDGNTSQRLGSRGLPKAMVSVGSNGFIFSCYNAVTNNSLRPCGFTVTVLGDGVYQMNFGFDVSTLFVSATGFYGSGGIGIGVNNIGVSFRSLNNSTMDFFTWSPGNPPDTIRANFHVILY
jgi:hypothetical protein